MAHAPDRRRALAALLAAALPARGSQAPQADPASDAPDPGVSRGAAAQRAPVAASYAEALQRWRGAADINAFIGERFAYDVPRALQLSESQRAQQPGPEILAPEAFFEQPRGVCVDLARFGVETLQQLAPELQPRYLMIEFDPVQIRGQTLRRHWLVQWRDAHGLWFFADSKRPGHIAGPYGSTQAFIDAYAGYRGRRIVAFRELASYQRQRRQQAQRSVRSDAPQP
jgi:hypothetical protein